MQQIYSLFRLPPIPLKQTLFFSFFLFSCLPAGMASFFLLISSSFAQGTGFVTLQGRQFKLNGSDFYPVVMNFGVEIAQNTTTNKGYICTVGYFGEDDTKFEFYGDPDESQEKYNEQFRAAFTKCLEMGFNCIRVGIAPQYVVNGKINPYDPDAELVDVKDPNNNYNSVAAYTGFTYPLIWYPVWYKQYMTLNNTYDPDECKAIKELFGFIDIVLAQAEAVGIKVILIAGGGNLWDSTTAVNAYAAYLSSLADHLKNNTALFAYDLCNEPGDATKSAMNSEVDKKEVCNYTELWYNAVKANDPNHLVTIGAGTDLDAMLWDPALMKADFLSPHIYPEELPFEKTGDASGYSRADAFERWKARVYWISQNSPLPWLIGETGFSALDDIPGFDEQNIYNRPPYMWGTEAEQASFARNSQQYVWDCGGNGYSWWILQDNIRNLIRCDGVNCSPVIITCPDGCTPVYNYTNLPDDVSGKPAYQNYWGLLYSNKDFDETSGIDKPSVNEFKNFKPQLQQRKPASPPDNYYNIFHHPVTSNTITGTVVDQNNKPIKDALVGGWTYINFGEDNVEGGDGLNGDKIDFHYTFTHSDGTFELIQYDYEPALGDPQDGDQTGLQIPALNISAAGAGRFFYRWGPSSGNIVSSLPTDNIFQLNRSDNIFSEVNGFTIETGYSEAYSAVNTLEASFVTVHPGASADFKAGKEVHITGEFHAWAGSETHIFTETIFSDCDEDIVNYNRLTNPDTSAVISQSAESKNIQLYFVPSSEKRGSMMNETALSDTGQAENEAAMLEVFPNPSVNGLFTVILPGYQPSSICIINVLSEKVFEKSVSHFAANGMRSIVIDLSAQPKGIYLLKTGNLNKKIVIN